MSKEEKGNIPGIRTFLSFIKDVVYPENAICRACGRIADSGCLCSACREELTFSGSAFSWEWKDVDGVRVYSMRPHDGAARTLVIRLKHQAEACLAGELADLILPVPAFLSFPSDTVVTWVTMPESRRRDRSIDHGKLLAEAVAERLGLQSGQLLLRADSSSGTQASLGRAQRLRNLENVFSAACPIDFPVLIVDDVLTTGTTISRCAGALRRAGALDITGLTITRSVYRQPSLF